MATNYLLDKRVCDRLREEGIYEEVSKAIEHSYGFGKEAEEDSEYKLTNLWGALPFNDYPKIADTLISIAEEEDRWNKGDIEYETIVDNQGSSNALATEIQELLNEVADGIEETLLNVLQKNTRGSVDGVEKVTHNVVALKRKLLEEGIL